MIRKIVNPTKQVVSACGFSTYKVKGNYPFKIATTQGSEQEGFVTKDAERVFEQFFKENPPQ